MATVLATKRGTVSQLSNYFYVEGRVLLESQDKKNNTSKIKVQLRHGTSNENRQWSGTMRDSFFRLDKAYTYFNDKNKDNTWASNPTVLFEKTYTVSHNTDGSKIIDLWLYTYIPSGGYGPGYCYVASKTSTWSVTLPKIDRAAPTVTLEVLSKTNNSITIQGSTPDDCDIMQYQINEGTWVTIQPDTPITISDLTPKSAYTIALRARKTENAVYGYATSVIEETFPNPVRLETVIATALDARHIAVTAYTNAPEDTASIQLTCGELSYSTDGGSVSHIFEVKPDTLYTVTATAYTLNSGLSDSLTTECTTPSEKYCTVIKQDGTVIPQRTLYLIDTIGNITEVPKEAITVLSNL